MSDFRDFTNRTDVQDTDKFGGHRGTTTVDGKKPESVWSFATLRSALASFFVSADALETKADADALAAHTADTNNPHAVTKAQIALGNVDNTSDAAKPVSTAQQSALNAKADKATTINGHDLSAPVNITKGDVGLGSVTNDAQVKRSEMGAADGVATLDSGGKIPAAQIPAIALVDFLGAAADQAAMLALTGQPGDWATRMDTGTNWIIIGSDPTQLASWREFTYPASPVTSVAGRTGAVVLAKGDVGLGNVDNTSDVNKPVSTAQQTALDAKVDKTTQVNGHALTGNLNVTKGDIGLGNVPNTDATARANHTGTQLAATISDFSAAVRTATGRPFYSVKDYGAVVDGVTDDSAAVQATIDAVAAAGGGTVFFPLGVTLCDGPWQTLSAGIKTILKLPDVPYASGANEYLDITFAGYADVPWNFSVLSAQVSTMHGSIIKTTKGSTTGGPSLIAGYSTDATGDNFTLVFAAFRNLIIRCPADPQISGLNMGKVGQAIFDNVVVDTGLAGSNCPLGTHSWATGIIAPAVNNAAFTRFRDCAVAGFYTGYAFDEHCDVDNCSAWYCEAALQFPTTNHVMRVARFLAVACHDVVKVVTQGSFPRSTFLIEQLGIEHEPGLNRYDVNDAASVGYGAISYHIVKGGTGPMNSEWAVNGATHVVATALENGASGGAQTPWLANENANGFSLSNLSGLAMRSTLTTDTSGAEALGVLNSTAKGRSGVTAGNDSGTLRGVGMFTYGPTQGTYGTANTAHLAFYGPLAYAVLETNFDNGGACDLYVRTAGGYFADTTHFSGVFRKNATDGGNQADWDAFGALTFRRRVVNKTAAFTVGAAAGQDWDWDNKKSATVFTNTGAAALVVGTMNIVNVGAQYTLYVDDADGMKLVVPAGVTIVHQGSASSSGGYIQSANVGDHVTLLAISTTKLVSISHNGTWTLG
jgi:hypothetical protein